MKWIKKGDLVLVICGNDRGKTGEVVLRKDDRVVVKGVNVRKKMIRKKQSSQPVYVEMPIHISNVALLGKDGKKIRVKRSSNKLVYKDKNGKEVVHREIIKDKKKR